MITLPYLRPLFAALLLAARLSAQTPATFEWLDAVKSPKDQHTLALLRVGPEGFHLLRWQEEQRDYTGKVTPGYPVLARLSPAGEPVSQQPVPGLEPDSGFVFQWAVTSDSVVLFGYEKVNSQKVHLLFIRTFDLVKNTWAGPEIDLFHTNTSFDKAWFSRSPDGSRTCLYSVDRKGLSFAVLDGAFQVLRKGWAPWPEGIGNESLVDIQQVFCSNQGAVLLHARSASPGAGMVRAPMRPTAYRADGHGIWPRPDASFWMSPFAAIVLLLKENTDEFDVFYPKIGKKYTSSFEFAQQGQGPVLCAGFASDKGVNYAESYFIYQIDPAATRAEMLQNAELPQSVRRAFPTILNDADKQAPLPSLRLRWLDWAADGRPWMLAEPEEQHNAIELPEAALLRLDSAWKIATVRRIDKFQEVEPMRDFRYNGSVASFPAGKSWWALWHKGYYPNASLTLTDCKSGGEPVQYELLSGARLVLALLPHTQYGYDGKWYFAGESANGDRFGVGVLKRTGKK